MRNHEMISSSSVYGGQGMDTKDVEWLGVWHSITELPVASGRWTQTGSSSAPLALGSSPTQRLLLKYDASTVLSEHLMSKSTVFVEIYNCAGSGGVEERMALAGIKGNSGSQASRGNKGESQVSVSEMRWSKGRREGRMRSKHRGSLKMQWTPEHSQWAEQHFDISSTTRSPAHKAEAYRAVPGHLQRSASYQYAWANDDISALTASNLLKKYAEKYSGILEMPGSYSEIPGVMNGRKGESEPWQDGVYPMSCIPEGVSIRKGGVAAASEVVSGMCSSPGLASSTLSEPSYSSSSCGSHSATALHSSSMASQEYGPPYSSSYLHSSYSSQSAPTPTLPSPLHSSGLLQPPPPPSHPTLVPAYNGGSPNLSSYNYPPAGYPAQSSVGPGYSPGGAPPPSSYLPPGIAAPTPLPPSSTLPGYPYQSHNLTPIAPTPLNSSSSNSLKRKAFYMAGQGEMDSYGGSRSTDSLGSFTSPSLSEQGAEDHRLHLSHSVPGTTSSSSSSSSRPAEEQLKTSDPHLLDMVTSEIVQQGPPVDWSDIAGLELAKAP
ncbi:hypothetical protein F7725_009206 [Dissostichus mawsoni]|uniref:Uncharacterized protein n=1 Tax=Dissostichus mawsoni TaxID=36200 RepID=A0A7J5Z9I5_DISMA|nr:hypothetical protein F7725_009206 [Dissostichus mawsoni]